ncbi:Uncharacterized NTE family protein YlbK [Chlamydiales bacterium SCGC AG-110-M15]|nr:Uncharacterized NTE family protein YlbK [Chlamydiales bacterium SCGC AG-110-M15]
MVKKFILNRMFCSFLASLFCVLSFSVYGDDFAVDIEGEFLGSDDAHGELYDTSLFPERIRVAVVLGGCSSRAVGYAGVIEEFVKAGIPMDLIVGASAGSVVGALYADIPDVEHLKDVLFNLKPTDLYRLDSYIWNQRFGVSDGEKMRETLRKLITVDNLEDLQIPFISTATDLTTGEMVCFNKGDVACAVHASSAYPPHFVPVKYNGRTLVDAGVSVPLPTHIARNTGAELVISVDFSLPLTTSQPNHFGGVMLRASDIMYLRLIRASAQEADVYVKLTLPLEMREKISFSKNPYLNETYLAGREAAVRAIPKILKALKEKGIM